MSRFRKRWIRWIDRIEFGQVGVLAPRFLDGFYKYIPFAVPSSCKVLHIQVHETSSYPKIRYRHWFLGKDPGNVQLWDLSKELCVANSQCNAGKGRPSWIIPPCVRCYSFTYIIYNATVAFPSTLLGSPRSIPCTSNRQCMDLLPPP